jgi:hypothetical protein
MTGARAVQGPDCHFTISAELLDYPLLGFRKTKPDAAKISTGAEDAIKTGRRTPSRQGKNSKFCWKIITRLSPQEDVGKKVTVSYLHDNISLSTLILCQQC